jgi:hypothetical protein
MGRSRGHFHPTAPDDLSTVEGDELVEHKPFLGGLYRTAELYFGLFNTAHPLRLRRTPRGG